MTINNYGTQLIREFEKQCGKELMEDSMRLGTFVLEGAIKNRYNQAAWCLITYDIYAIDTVMGWYIEYPEHMFVDENDTYSCDELIAVLDKCIDKF